MSLPTGARPAIVVLTLLALALPASAQEAITGMVVDQRGEPLPGAQVSVEGTSIGTVTNQDGRFLLQAVTGDEVTLEVMMLGHRTVRQDVAPGATDVRIELEETAIDLDGIVVTGTPGAQQRRSVANAVSTVRASELAETQPINGIDEMINGRSAGVVVTPPSGAAGGGSRILIRGRSSISLDIAPLIYVDGVRVDNRQAGGSGGRQQTSRLNDIDIDDIESIEIIKGPAAATLYGTEASNGVIQIITKKGQAGDTQIDVSVRQGASWFHDPEGRWPINFFEDPGSGEIIPYNLAQQETDRGTPLFRTAHNQGYSLAASGGSETVQFYTAANYDRDEGATPDNLSERYSGRVNVNATPSDEWTLNGQLASTILRTDLASTGYMFDAVLSRPSTRNTPQRGFFTAPSEARLAEFEQRQEVDRVTGGAEIRHRPSEWLNHRLRVGFDVSDDRFIDLTRRMSPENARFFSEGAAAGEKEVDQTNVLNTTIDYNTNMVLDLTPDLTTTTTGGFQYYREITRFLEASGLEFPSPDVTSVAGAAQRRGAEDEVENVTVGVFIQEQLGWKNRLFLTGAVRGDDNSAFGQDFDFVTYPKASVSWVLSEEDFWNVSWVDQLRLRSAWGQSGQQPTAFAALRTFQPITGQAGSPGVTPQFVGNPELGPEKSSELEVGFETSLFDGRLGIDFTYFDQTTEDAILLRDVAPSTGFPAQQFVNAGKVSNTGFEVMLDGTPVRSRDLEWNVGLNLSKVDNEVVTLGLEDIEFLEFGFGNRFQPGFPAFSFFARKVVSAEHGPDGTPINIQCDGGTPSGRPGGAPVDCDTAPRVFAGAPDPDWEGSVSTSLTLWDRLTVSGLLDFKLNHHIWTSVLWCPGILDCEEEVFPERFPAEIAASSVLGLTDDHRWIRDLSFAKIREVSVSYRLPEEIAQRVGASSGHISLSGRNLHTFTDFESLDPENVSTFPEAGGGTPFEQNEVPQLRQLVTKINLSF